MMTGQHTTCGAGPRHVAAAGPFLSPVGTAPARRVAAVTHNHHTASARAAAATAAAGTATEATAAVEAAAGASSVGATGATAGAAGIMAQAALTALCLLLVHAARRRWQLSWHASLS